MNRSIAAVCLLVLFATAADAAKPAPAPAPPFVPAFAYYLSGQTYELRLSNEAGTAAVLVQRASRPIGVFKFSPASQRALYYFDPDSPGQMKKVSWSYNSAGAFVLGAPSNVLTAGVADFALSPDGSTLAYQRLLGELSDESTFELRIRDLASGTDTLVAITDFSYDVDWSPDGAWIYLRQGDPDFPNTNRRPFKILRIAPQANATPEKLATGEVLLTSAALKPLPQGSTQPLGFLFSVMREEWGLDSSSQHFGMWDGLTVTADGKPLLDFNFPLGSWASFACGNRKFVYKSYDSRNRPSTNIYNLDTRQVQQFSRDANIQGIEWIGC